MVRVPEGFRVREARKRQGITQTALAKNLGISVSYLNLIEHNKRSIGGHLLARMAQILAVDLTQLAGFEDARLIQDLTDLSGDALFRDLSMEERGAQDIIGREPGWGRAFLRLHGSYIEATEMVEALSDRLNRDPFLVESSHEILTQITSIRSFSEILVEFGDLPENQRQQYISLLADASSRLSVTAKSLFTFMDEIDTTARPTTPAGEVEDFIIDHRNYFSPLEQAAEVLRGRVESCGEMVAGALTEYLAEHHGTTLKRLEPGVEANRKTEQRGSPAGRSFARIDYHHVGSELFIQRGLHPETERFLIAQFIFEQEYSEILSEITSDKRLTSDDARRRAHRAMARYAAGAMLFPYEPFLRMAEEVRYDIQILQQHFAGSFEQICQRLVTLQRPGSQNVPFVFLRADPAGNISKRFSSSNLRLPRYGGACPLWALYRAFLSPGQIVSQVVQMPDEQEFLFVARTVSKKTSAYGVPDKIYSVMIGCDAVYADRLVYGDGLDRNRASLVTKAGINCRLCTRPACDYRAHAPILPITN